MRFFGSSVCLSYCPSFFPSSPACFLPSFSFLFHSLLHYGVKLLHVPAKREGPLTVPPLWSSHPALLVSPAEVVPSKKPQVPHGHTVFQMGFAQGFAAVWCFKKKGTKTVAQQMHLAMLSFLKKQKRKPWRADVLQKTFCMVKINIYLPKNQFRVSPAWDTPHRGVQPFGISGPQWKK